LGFSFWRRTPSRARCEVPSTRVNLIFWNKSSTADSGSLTEVFKVHKYFWPFLLSPTFNFFHFRFLEESLNQPNITKDGIVHEIIPDLPNLAKLFLLTKDGSKNVTLKMKHTIFVNFFLKTERIWFITNCKFWMDWFSQRIEKWYVCFFRF
jgi:hypothetical protein